MSRLERRFLAMNYKRGNARTAHWRGKGRYSKKYHATLGANNALQQTNTALASFGMPLSHTGLLPRQGLLPVVRARLWLLKANVRQFDLKIRCLWNRIEFIKISQEESIYEFGGEHIIITASIVVIML